MEISYQFTYGEFIPWRIHTSLHLENSYRGEFIPFFDAHEKIFIDYSSYRLSFGE